MNFKLKLKVSSSLALIFLIIYMLKPVAAQAPTQPAQSQQPLQAVQNQPQNTTPTQNAVGEQQVTNPAAQEVFNNFGPGVPKNISTLTQGSFLGILSAATCALAGVDPLQAEGKCLTSNLKTGQLVYSNQEGGIASTMGGLIGSTMNIPISGTEYTQYMASSFGITGTAYAQGNGLGYDRLRPLLGVWIRFRDIAYLLFALAFTIIGFAIILRVKIDARTVMTIQNQIPKIIIALVLVTFSYAIAGFLIDLMYVAMYLIIITFTDITPVKISTDSTVFGVINTAFKPGLVPDIPNGASQFTGFVGAGYSALNTGIVGMAIQIAKITQTIFASMATDFIDSVIMKYFIVFFIPFKMIELTCSGVVGLTNVVSKIPGLGGLGSNASCDIQDYVGEVIGAIFAIVAFLIILIAILFNLFRVWFTLIKSFMYVLVDTMIAPLWITAGIFPGSKLNFSGWIKHLMGHLSVFPTCFAVILLGKTMMDGVSEGGSFFSPPLIGDAFAGNSALAAFIGFGFIISLPTILDRTRTAIGAVSFGLKDIQAGLSAGRGIGGAGISSVVSPGVEYKSDGTPERMGKLKSFTKNIGIIK